MRVGSKRLIHLRTTTTVSNNMYESKQQHKNLITKNLSLIHLRVFEHCQYNVGHLKTILVSWFLLSFASTTIKYINYTISVLYVFTLPLNELKIIISINLIINNQL